MTDINRVCLNERDEQGRVIVRNVFTDKEVGRFTPEELDELFPCHEERRGPEWNGGKRFNGWAELCK